MADPKLAVRGRRMVAAGCFTMVASVVSATAMVPAFLYVCIGFVMAVVGASMARHLSPLRPRFARPVGPIDAADDSPVTTPTASDEPSDSAWAMTTEPGTLLRQERIGRWFCIGGASFLVASTAGVGLYLMEPIRSVRGLEERLLVGACASLLVSLLLFSIGIWWLRRPITGAGQPFARADGDVASSSDDPHECG